MRRYRFLGQQEIYDALNKLRAAFLAAKSGEDVDEIIKGILSYDERIKIGRRIIISQLISEGITYDSIKQMLKVGTPTITQVQKSKENFPKCFELINKREEKVEDEYSDKAYEMIGNPKYFKKYPKYTGFKRKNVKR